MVNEPWREPLQGTLPILDDGRPATFLAVTNDYAAVEVDTETGSVIRMVAQVSTAEDVQNAECAACVNAVDGIWRLADGSAYLMSECCEPAAGAMFWMGPAQQVTPETHDFAESLIGWWAAPSPASPSMAVAGYGLSIVNADYQQLWNWFPSGDFNSATPTTWNRDLSALWVFQDDPPGVGPLWKFDLATSAATSVRATWIDGDQFLSGLGTQASGRLVTFRLTPDGDDDFGNDPVRGIVFEPTGELVAEFDVEPGSRMGGYDPSGRFLIYVDGDGTVRWQGVGQSGPLGEGYLFASW
jgi:hypothetical protein